MLVAVLCAYRPAWNGQPVWDDDGHMTKPELRSAAGLGRIWTELGATQQYYPLVHTVFWVEHRLFGDSTTGYHLFSILLHFASALLVVTILTRLQIRGAWLAGWLFALHPVMVESVAWITELKNTLSAVFFLGAALAYLGFDRTRDKRRYGLAAVLFVLGLLAKTVVGTLPVALLVIFWWMRGRIDWRRDVAPLSPFLAVGLTSGLFTAWVERRFIGAVGSEFSLTVIDRCLIAGRAIWFYLSKLLLPADLIFIYPRWNIDATAAWQYLFPLAFVLALVFCYRLRGRSRTPLAVLLYFAATLFPALGFFNIYPFRYSFVADHFQYLAAIGPLAAAAAGITRGIELLAARYRRPVRWLVHGALPLSLFLLCWHQSGTYADAATLYQATLSRNPECWMAHYNLGILLAKAGQRDRAGAHYRKALAINPQHAKAHINLGVLLAETGQADDALAHYRKALELNPRSAEAHYNLGFLLAALGRAYEAGAHYRKALEISPNHADAHNNLAGLLEAMGRSDEAVAHYARALEVSPGDGVMRNNLGILLAKLGRDGEASAQFQKALEVNPRSAEAHNNLGILLAKAKQTDEAISHYQRALAITPQYTEAHGNLGLLLAETGRTAEAIVHYRAALASARAAGDEPRARMMAQRLMSLQETAKSFEVTPQTNGRR